MARVILVAELDFPVGVVVKRRIIVTIVVVLTVAGAGLGAAWGVGVVRDRDASIAELRSQLVAATSNNKEATETIADLEDELSSERAALERAEERAEDLESRLQRASANAAAARAAAAAERAQAAAEAVAVISGRILNWKPAYLSIDGRLEFSNSGSVGVPAICLVKIHYKDGTTENVTVTSPHVQANGTDVQYFTFFWEDGDPVDVTVEECQAR